jgi:hypothetical protein
MSDHSGLVHSSHRFSAMARDPARLPRQARSGALMYLRVRLRHPPVARLATFSLLARLHRLATKSGEQSGLARGKTGKHKKQSDDNQDQFSWNARNHAGLFPLNCGPFQLPEPSISL